MPSRWPARRRPAAEHLKSPAGIATVGAALIALPLAAQGVAKLTGGKAAKAGQRVKEKATEKAKDVADDVADDTIKEKMPKGLGGLVKGRRPEQSLQRQRRFGLGRGRRGSHRGSRKRAANADATGGRRRRSDHGGLQPLDRIRGMAVVHASRRQRSADRRLRRSRSRQRSGESPRTSRPKSSSSDPTSGSCGTSTRA